MPRLEALPCTKSRYFCATSMFLRSNRELHLQRAQIEIGARHVGNQSKPTRRYGRLAAASTSVLAPPRLRDDICRKRRSPRAASKPDEIDYLPDASGVFGGP